MRIARVVAVALSLTGLSAVPALAQGPTFGLEAGISMAHLSPEASGQSISSGAGLLVGAYVHKPMFATMGLQIELVYAQKNSQLTSTTDLKMDYIELPILAKLKIVKSVYLVEGLAFGFPVRARIQPASGAEQDIKSQIHSPDIGLVIGGGVPIQNFAIEGRFENGFKHVNDTAGAQVQRNRALSLIVRVHF